MENQETKTEKKIVKVKLSDAIKEGIHPESRSSCL